MRLKVNIVRAPNQPLQDYRSGIPFDTLKQYGFQQMLLNVVKAPEPVLAFFCQYHGLHHIPLAGSLRPREVDRITTELQNLRRFFTADMQVRGLLVVWRREGGREGREGERGDGTEVCNLLYFCSIQ